MSMTTLTVERRRSLLAVRAADYLELTKPKIALLELVTVATAALLAGLDGLLLLHAMIGTALVAGSASALNHWWEAETDRLMPRTARRPLAAGRLAPAEALLFGLVTCLAGIAYLAAAVNLLTALLGAASWALYVLVYTPMKRQTPANTAVGAVAGAMPVLMGWSAMGAPMDLRTGALFLIVFLWQFPHFMAIAWIYRREYRAAGMKMLTVVEPTGWRAGAQALLAALILVPISLLPALLPLGGNWLPWQAYGYFAAALLLGVLHLLCSGLFLASRRDASARRLLRASLIYLPSLLLALVALELSSPLN